MNRGGTRSNSAVITNHCARPELAVGIKVIRRQFRSGEFTRWGAADMNSGHHFTRFASPTALGAVAAAILVTALPAVLTSCCGSNDTCTQIGCDDGLKVVLEGTLPSGVTVEAIAAGGERRTEQCAHVDPCSVLFEGFHPEEVTVRVTWDGNTEVVTARLNYAESRPNGRCCPPMCRTATMSIVL